MRASSETAGKSGRHIVNGVHRVVYDKSNRWVSDPAKGLPQWIELRFDGPRRVREIHLAFDTGLIRRLTLSQSDDFSAHMVRGPQPETVKDYELLLLDGEKERSIVSVDGNYQRKRVHQFEPRDSLGCSAAGEGDLGDPSARLFEIRAYG